MLVKMTGVALVAAGVLVSAILWQVYSCWREDELAELEAGGRLLGRLIALHCVEQARSGDLAGFKAVLTELSETMGTVNAVALRDREGQHLAGIGPEEPRGRVREVIVPIEDEIGGSLVISMKESQVEKELALLTGRLGPSVAIIAGLSLGGALWVACLFTRPIKELVQKTRAVKEGDYAARASVRGGDEIGELTEAFNEMVAQLQERKAVERRLLRNLMSAEDDECRRVARELHDHTGQALTALNAGLAALQGGTCPPGQVTRLLTLAAQALCEVNDLSRTLRPVALDELGLPVALKRLCETCSQRLSLDVTCQTIGFEPSGRLPQALEIALYRISQEAITNAVRHGRARTVSVVLHLRPASVLAVIEDDGEGFDATDWQGRCLRGKHSGLLSMQERAALLGGSFCIESRAGGGASLFVEIPLNLS